MLLWKLFMLIFKVSKRHNYAKEAAYLLLQKHCLLSECRAAQLAWGQFVNIQGQNIPTDLYMEHLNKRLKNILQQLGSNIKSEQSIVRLAKAIGFVHNVCRVFESECGQASQNGKHEKDLLLMTNSLLEERVFSVIGKG